MSAYSPYCAWLQGFANWKIPSQSKSRYLCHERDIQQDRIAYHGQYLWEGINSTETADYTGNNEQWRFRKKEWLTFNISAALPFAWRAYPRVAWTCGTPFPKLIMSRRTMRATPVHVWPGTFPRVGAIHAPEPPVGALRAPRIPQVAYDFADAKATGWNTCAGDVWILRFTGHVSARRARRATARRAGSMLALAKVLAPSALAQCRAWCFKEVVLASDPEGE